MSKKHAEGQYKADELKKWLNEECTSGQMYAELLTLVEINSFMRATRCGEMDCLMLLSEIM